MWVLLMMFFTSGGELITYDHGEFVTSEECEWMGTEMVTELLEAKYTYICVEWKR